MESSDAEAALQSPQSPDPMWRPRRRSNRNQTPQRIDEGVGIYKHSPGVSTIRASSISFQQHVIVPLFINVCQLFAEWLSVSPCPENASFIAQAAIEWCPKILTEMKDDTSSMDLYDAVLPAFLRTIGQILTIPGNCDVLKEILNTMSNDARSIDVMKRVLSSILIPKANQLMINDIVNCFLNVTYDSLPVDLNNENVELPDGLDDDWILPKRSLTGLLAAIMSHQQACITLANNLIERFEAHTKGTSINEIAAFFDLQCMWILMSDTTTSKIDGNNTVAMITTVQQVVLRDVHDGGLTLLIEEFLSRAK
jgi:hypothetical protein